MAGVGGHVDCRGRCLQRSKKSSQGVRRTAILSDHHRGDALGNFGERCPVLQNQTVCMAVGVNKARGQDETAGVDDCVLRKRRHLAHGHNTTGLDSSAPQVAWAARAINNDRVGDQGGGKQ